MKFFLILIIILVLGGVLLLPHPSGQIGCLDIPTPPGEKPCRPHKMNWAEYFYYETKLNVIFYKLESKLN